jgi:DegV family protein with EDD domain
MSKYQIFTDSNCDLSTEVRKEHGLEYVRMGVVVDGKEYPADLDWKEYTPEEFYGWLNKGAKVKTNAVNMLEFETKFRPLLAEGTDILYLACSSALTTSANTCRLVSEDLLKEFPERKIVIVDTLNASLCIGLMAIHASKLQKEGKTIDEVAEWLNENKLKFNFHVTVETLTYMKNAGRIKGSKAFFGNIFGIKPIIISDAKGNNLGVATVRGTKNADNELIARTKEVFDKNAGHDIYIAHAMCLERALKLKQRIINEIGVEPKINYIGPIVGATCGPGTIAIFAFGKEVTRFEGDGIKE